MSYDLYFKRRDNKQLIKEECLLYFKTRTHYDVSETQAIYDNEETGIYFDFGWSEDEKDFFHNVPENELELLPLNLQLNLYRPHIFALEADVELQILVKHFDLLINDIQIDDEKLIEYDSDLFLSTYNTSNKASVKAINDLPNDKPEFFYLPNKTN